jgi:hypothetical protein
MFSRKQITNIRKNQRRRNKKNGKTTRVGQGNLNNSILPILHPDIFSIFYNYLTYPEQITLDIIGKNFREITQVENEDAKECEKEIMLDEEFYNNFNHKYDKIKNNSLYWMKEFIGYVQYLDPEEDLI